MVLVVADALGAVNYRHAKHNQEGNSPDQEVGERHVSPCAPRRRAFSSDRNLISSLKFFSFTSS
ncbi:hypothetical protein C7S13_3054 [Burkholderia cepacia]|nr:hypothetical protein [Burkholderia cepacia]